jgi:hypothetical protein
LFEIVFRGGKPSSPSWKKRDRLVEVLEPVLPELGQLVVDERPRRFRYHHLAPVC